MHRVCSYLEPPLLRLGVQRVYGHIYTKALLTLVTKKMEKWKSGGWSVDKPKKFRLRCIEK